jgi:hypothetical protein
MSCKLRTTDLDKAVQNRQNTVVKVAAIVAIVLAGYSFGLSYFPNRLSTAPKDPFL